MTLTAIFNFMSFSSLFKTKKKQFKVSRKNKNKNRLKSPKLVSRRVVIYAKCSVEVLPRPFVNPLPPYILVSPTPSFFTVEDAATFGFTSSSSSLYQRLQCYSVWKHTIFCLWVGQSKRIDSWGRWTYSFYTVYCKVT